MNPDLSTAAAIATLIQFFSGIGPLTFLASLFLTPWCVLIFVSYQQHRRFEAVVEMYRNNVVLAEGFQELSKKHQELTIWTTQAVTEAKEVALNNLHCPIVRKTSKPKDIQ